MNTNESGLKVPPGGPRREIRGKFRFPSSRSAKLKKVLNLLGNNRMIRE